jgi:hypothetical protein
MREQGEQMSQPQNTTYTYLPVVQNQKANPFCQMSPQDTRKAKDEFSEKLGWLVQKSQSRDKFDKEFWTAVMEADSMFGRSQKNQCANSALSALGGAVEKLQHGDLSQKQIDNIQPVLDLLHKHYPDKWGKTDFVDGTPKVKTTTAPELFEFK